MKRRFFLFFLFTLLPSFLVCSPERDIIPKEYYAALKKSKSENKKLIVLFGASWCPDCRALDVILSEKEPSKLLQSQFIVLKIDVGRFDKNLELNEKLGSPIDKGIPALVVLKPNGEIQTSTKGGEFSNASKMSKEQVLQYLYSL